MPKFRIVLQKSRSQSKALTLKDGKNGLERLQKSGLGVSTLPSPVMVQTVKFGSEAAKYGLAPGDEVTAVLIAAERPNRYWFALPALGLLAIIVLLQLRRRKPALKAATA